MSKYLHAGLKLAAKLSMNLLKWRNILITCYTSYLYIKSQLAFKAPEYWWASHMQFILIDIMLVPKIHKHQAPHWKLGILHTAYLEKHCHHCFYLCYCLTYSAHISFIIFLPHSLVSHGFFMKWLRYGQWNHICYLPTSNKADWTYGKWKSGDLSLDLAFLFADSSLDFRFLKHKMQRRKISTLHVPIFCLYQPQAMVVLKDRQVRE